MDIRNEEDDSREKELNFRYKDLTEEEKFVDKVILEEDSTNEINYSEVKPKITKEDIMKSVMEQVKKVKREDTKQEPIIKESNTDEWFNEYQRQPIEINAERVRAYLESYNDLDNLIKYREDKLISGNIKPESKVLEVNKLADLEFLNNSSINKEDFYSKVDYKLREMRFYKTNLSILIRNLKLYGFLVYQFLVFKYFLKLDEENIGKLTPFKNLDYLDSLAINYLKNKLIEEAKKECQD